MSGAQPAYVEEVDDQTGQPVNRRTAKKKVELAVKETHSSDRRHSRKENGPGESRRGNAGRSSSTSPPLKRAEPRVKEERRKSSISKSPTKPPSVHNNSSYPQELPMRPYQQQPIFIQRAITQPQPRPSSFHEGMSYNAYGPPLSSSAYFIPSNSLMPAPSYPPPSPLGMGGYMTYANGGTYHQNSGGALPPGFRQDFSTPAPQLPVRSLKERLGGESRRRSIPYTPGSYEDRGYESAYERSAPITRKPPSPRKSKAQIDAERMPPPPLRPILRSTTRYADDELLDDEEYYETRSRPAYEEERAQSRQRRPSLSRQQPKTYTYGSSNETRMEPGRSRERGSRRNSYYAEPSYAAYGVPAPVEYENRAGDSVQDRLRAAESYQTSVGGPPTKLTAESLKKANRRSQPASSHSTRSSGSRDESERQRSSVTTRTTRTTGTGAGLEEDITIKLKGTGKIKIAGAEIDFDKDTELNIRRGNGGGDGGSQRSSEFGGSEDRRSRNDRTSERSRRSSNVRYKERPAY